MRPVLGLVKRLQEAENPTAIKQAEIALRYHAHEGNTKWVSLLLWAGADPVARGLYRLEELDQPAPAEDEEQEDDLYHNAIELAVLGRKVEVLKLKKLLPATDPHHPEAATLLDHAWDCEMLSFLLERGHRPGALKDQGTGLISTWLNFMSFDYSFDGKKTGIDSQRSREYMKMVHMLLAHGGRWLPEDRHRINDTRRHLLKMAPSYTLELLWLLQRYGAARRNDVRELLRSPSMARLLGKERTHAEQIVAETAEEPSEERPPAEEKST